MRGMQYLTDRPGCEFPEQVKIVLRPSRGYCPGWTKPKARGRNNNRRSSMDKTGQSTRTRQRLELLALHGPTCHLCFYPIDLDLKWPDPGCFTRDHVIPRAAGGPDTIDNLRPAHHECNVRRGDEPI